MVREGDRMGMPLGLPLARRNVEAMNGTLEIASEPGAGTTVRVVLPINPR